MEWMELVPKVDVREGGTSAVLLDVGEFAHGLGHLALGDGLGQDLLHLVHLFFLALLRVCSHLPFLNVLSAGLQLQVVDLRTNVGQLVKNWHHNKLDEASLSTGDVGRGPITHHGDV
jgi:hypothetical protein